MTNLFWELCRFGVVGVVAAAIHLSIVMLIVQVWSVAPLLANIVAFGLSFQVSYWGHRLWTFGQTTAAHRDAFLRLVLIQTLNFAANESLFYIFLSLDIPYPFALLIVLTILPIFTFVSSKLWVFR